MKRLALLTALAALAVSGASAGAANAAPMEPYITGAKVVSPGSAETEVTYSVKGTGQQRQFLQVFKEGKWLTTYVNSPAGPYVFKVKELTAGTNYVFKLCAPVSGNSYHGCEGVTDGETGEVIWRGDGVSKPLWEQWSQLQNDFEWKSVTEHPYCNARTSEANILSNGERLAFTTNPEESHLPTEASIHFHMAEGDYQCGGNGGGKQGRSELTWGSKFGFGWPHFILPGHEGWFAFQVQFPKTYPLNSKTVADGGVMQFHGYGGTGGVPFGISVGRECTEGSGEGPPHEGGPEVGYMVDWFFATSSNPHKHVNCDSKKIEAGAVYDILIHAKFTEESDSNGFEHTYLNGVQVDEYHGPFGLNTANESTLNAGLYPDNNRTEKPPMDLYEAGWTLATTRGTAEANAF
jgi:hypothetical protein